jgi:hypothetical protein
MQVRSADPDGVYADLQLPRGGSGDFLFHQSELMRCYEFGY